jgi:membrane fusion protein (multidrug efflux system)
MDTCRFLTAQPRAATPAGVAAVGLLLCLLLPACSKEDAKPAGVVPRPRDPLSVRVLRVEAKPLDETLEITGSLVSSVAVDVKTEFAGRVASMLKQEGDRVGKGELLAQLDDLNARLSVAQARANLEVVQATVERAKVAEDHARTELERAQNLLKSGGITDRDFQTAQVSARDTRAQVKLAEAQVEQSRQALAITEKRLNDCRIISPITGEVERKLFNPGSWVDANVLLYRLVDNQRLELQTYVASSDVARVAKDQKIRFSVAAYPGEEFVASLRTLSAAVDSQNRSVLVRAAVPNPAGKLQAGMFVKGDIVTGTKPAALVVPMSALWRRVGQPPFVFVVEQNCARQREVQIGVEQPQGVEIAGGLAPGDLVVAEQNLELADGMRVTPRS